MKLTPPLNISFDELNVDEAMIASAMVAAAYYSEDEVVQILPADPNEISEEVLREGANAVSPSGANFVIPLLIPEEMASGDERAFELGALSHRDLPLSLLWQIKTGSGHDGSVIVGRIDSIERVADGLGNARGVFDVGPYGREAERLVRGQFLRGVSADLDKFRGTRVEETETEFSDGADIKSEKIIVHSGRVMAATLVPKPAFQECYIMIEEPASMSTGDEAIADGVYEEFLDDIDNELASLAASAAPVVPPRTWFSDPKLDGPTPLTVADDGRVFGHIAAWHVSHIGLPRATKPPRSASNYAYFRTGTLKTEEGDVFVGQLTLAGGHAPLHASARDAVKHYDDTASAVADVVAGEDQFGIWVAGALRPEVTPQQVRAFRASSPSGDWRPINNNLELVAVCQVNVPGFPVARTMVAGGQITALVAAGASALAELRDSDTRRLMERVDSIESAQLSAKRDEALAMMKPLLDKRNEELEALAASAAETMASLKEEREAELSARIEEARKAINEL